MEKRKPGLFDVRHPIFRPLWRRIALTAFCFGWAAIEWSNDGPFWGLLFGACGVHLLIQFFVKFDPADYAPPSEKDVS